MKVIHLVSNRVWGGGERYVLDLALTQMKSGFRVKVFTRGFPAVDVPMAAAGLQLGKLPLRGELDFISPLRLAKEMMEGDERQIIVHSHNFKDAVIAVRARKIAMTFGSAKGRDIRIVCTRHLAKRGKTGIFSRELYNGLDAIIFISELTKNEFLSSSPKIDPGKIHVIPNSIIPTPRDAGCFPNAHSDKDHHNDDDVIRLLYLGRISPEKGLETLLEAMSCLKDINVELAICGSGDDEYAGGLKEMCATLGLEEKVRWLGHQSDVYGYIRSSDIGVVPSKCREAFGLVLLEFMSQGVPVISTDSGAQREIITDGREGLLVPPERPDALAEAIRVLATEPAKRREMGQTALLRYESSFSYQRFFSAITKLYRALLR